MPFRLSHTGDIHLEEDRYFGDTAQCLESFVYKGIRENVNLFVIDGDLTTYKATIKERNLWIDMVIRMAEHAPVLLVAGNHGRESDGDLYALAKARGQHRIHLSTEPDFVEFDRAAVAVFPYPPKAEVLRASEASSLQNAFVNQLEG